MKFPVQAQPIIRTSRQIVRTVLEHGVSLSGSGPTGSWCCERPDGSLTIVECDAKFVGACLESQESACSRIGAYSSSKC